MVKITKKYLMEKAINTFSQDEIDKSNHCKIVATFKDDLVIEGWASNLDRKRKLSKREYILKETRSLLMNVKWTDSNKRPVADLSSNNIESIKYYLS